MKIRVVLRDREIIPGSDGKSMTQTTERHVDISGDALSWAAEKLDEYNAFLVVTDDDENKEVARFVGGSWEYVRVLDEDDEEDVADYTS